MVTKSAKRAAITREQIQRFETALDDARQREAPAGTDQGIWRAYQDGLASQIVSLRKELAD